MDFSNLGAASVAALGQAGIISFEDLSVTDPRRIEMVGNREFFVLVRWIYRCSPSY